MTDWTAKDEDNEDISVWEDNWDDDDVEDDFNQQLRYTLSNGHFKVNIILSPMIAHLRSAFVYIFDEYRP